LQKLVQAQTAAFTEEIAVCSTAFMHYYYSDSGILTIYVIPTLFTTT